MDSKSLIRATVRGTFWEYLSKYSARIFVFISTAILARILNKEEFGVASYAIVAINFIEFLQGLGLRQALIYYPKSEKQNNTAFILGIGSGVLLTIFSFFVVAPLAGLFFNNPRAVPVTRVLSFYFILVSSNIVQDAILSKRLAFGLRAIPGIGNSLLKGLVSISLALLGFGAWSLIYGQLAGTFVEVALFWHIAKWKPKFQIEKQSVRPLLSYGLNIFSISAISNLMSNIDYLLIGRYLGAENLGVYTLAFRLPTLLIKQFSGILGNVIFPVFSKIKDDVNALRRSFLIALEYVSLITVPVGLGLVVVAKLIILVLFGEKWLDATPVMVAVSILSMLRAMVYNTGDTYKAMGKPGLLAKINFWQAIVTIPSLWYGVTQIKSIAAIAWIQVVIAIVFGLIKLTIAVNVLNIKPLKILNAFKPSVLSGSIMSLIVYFIVQAIETLPAVVILLVAVGVGVVIYIGFLYIINRKSVLQIYDRLKSGISRNQLKDNE